jgi:hypothetical protein
MAAAESQPVASAAGAVLVASAEHLEQLVLGEMCAPCPDLLLLSTILGFVEEGMMSAHLASRKSRKRASAEAEEADDESDARRGEEARRATKAAMSVFPVAPEAVLPALDSLRSTLFSRFASLRGAPSLSRADVKAVADFFHSLVSKGYHSDRLHAQSVWAIVSKRQADCFALGVAVVGALYALGHHERASLCLSEDHCWVHFRDASGAAQTAEVAWSGPGAERRRGEPVALDGSWLYQQGHALVCSPREAVVAVVNGVASTVSIADRTQCHPLSVLKRRLLRACHREGALRRYVQGLANLADLEDPTWSSDDESEAAAALVTEAELGQSQDAGHLHVAQHHRRLPHGARRSRLPPPSAAALERSAQLYEEAIARSRSDFGDSAVYPYVMFSQLRRRMGELERSVQLLSEGARVTSRYASPAEDQQQLKKEFGEAAEALLKALRRHAEAEPSQGQDAQPLRAELLADWLRAWDLLAVWEERGGSDVFVGKWPQVFLATLRLWPEGTRAEAVARVDFCSAKLRGMAASLAQTKLNRAVIELALSSTTFSLRPRPPERAAEDAEDDAPRGKRRKREPKREE